MSHLKRWEVSGHGVSKQLWSIGRLVCFAWPTKQHLVSAAWDLEGGLTRRGGSFMNMVAAKLSGMGEGISARPALLDALAKRLRSAAS